MNLWRKLMVLDKKIDDKSRNRMGDILTLIFNLSFICGILYSAVTRSIQIKMYSKNQENIHKIEIDQMNKLVEKALLR